MMNHNFCRWFPFRDVFIHLDEIPKGNTGKIQRIGLAKKLGLET